MQPTTFRMDTLKVNDETYMLRMYKASPPLGVLSFNSYVILGKEPILVDTHAPIWRKEYFEEVWKIVDPKDVKWVFLTHDDRDHSGNLMQVLEMCPNAKLVTQWLAVGRMKDEFAFSLPRLQFCNPGEPWTASGRTFGTALPPIYDSPSSCALFDPKHDVLFSADSFGAMTKQPYDEVSAIEQDYADGVDLFSGMYSWVHEIDRAMFAKRVAAFGAFPAKTVLSGHGPIARGNFEGLLRLTLALPDKPPFVGPDQRALEAMIAKL